MKVVLLQAENFKRLKAVEIAPDGNVVVLAGANAQGKSSILDAMWAALGGTRANPGDPIRHGETEARVQLDLGELVVTRTWRGDKTSLNVTGANGSKITSPQKVLDTLVGKIAFDPLRFANAAAKDQLSMLLEVVAVPINLGVVAAQRAEAFEKRTEIGREVKRLQGALDSLPPVPATTPNDEVDVVAEMQVLADAERDLQAMRGLLARKEEIEAELAAIMQTASVIAARIPAPFRELEAWVEVKKASMLEVEQTNASVRARKARIQGQSDVRKAQQEYETQSALIAKLDESKAQAIARTPMPVPGLSFTDEGVTYNGVPFAQASAAERIRVSVGIAVAANPQLRVVHIADGSLLDSASRQALAELAVQHDVQVWVEVVDESGAVGFTIEDGMVVS